MKRGLEEAALIVPYARLSGFLAVGHNIIVNWLLLVLAIKKAKP